PLAAGTGLRPIYEPRETKTRDLLDSDAPALATGYR
ncbi:MAG: hypothetical protein JWR35_1084, partial [Marmoricola sp.]|nr:hypothetical protein [Marmoricola sp.]